MLEPDDRNTVLESLRPPEGFTPDFAIGTTFSLDLLALLTAPLGFTFYELAGDAGEVLSSADPLVLLRTLREHAGRIAIFCQAGRIAVPSRHNPLLAQLEESIIEVRAPSPGGAFHPKLWVLRFVGGAGSVRYRVICASRNLTFDRSWDTALVLDGELTGRKRAFAANHPLADFVASLPGFALAQERVPGQVRERVGVAADELRRVRFELPEGFEAYAMWPLGIPDYRRWPLDGRADRRLVISPFLSAGAVRRLGSPGSGSVLVSRFDSLQALPPEDLAGFDQVYAFDPAVTAEIAADAGEESGLVGGLHAKLFASDRGWNASLWTGSANATDAAFGSNVEFLVELRGKASRCGVDALLGRGDDRTTRLRDLLVPFTPPEQPASPDPDRTEVERLIREARNALSGTPWVARVSGQEPEFSVAFAPESGAWPALPERVRGRCWPISLPAGNALRLAHGGVLDFGPFATEALTAFFAFEIEASVGQATQKERFVVTARLQNAPGDRAERVLTALLGSAEQLLRFLMLLLVIDDDSTDGLADTPGLWGVGAGGGSSEAESLLEPLLRALIRRPEAIDRVAEALQELRRTEAGARLIPDALERVWPAIWQARQELAPSRTDGGCA